MPRFLVQFIDKRSALTQFGCQIVKPRDANRLEQMISVGDQEKLFFKRNQPSEEIPCIQLGKYPARELRHLEFSPNPQRFVKQNDPDLKPVKETHLMRLFGGAFGEVSSQVKLAAFAQCFSGFEEVSHSRVVVSR